MTLTKNQRFQQWRGAKVSDEQKFMDTANLVASYIEHASLLHIRQDTAGGGDISHEFLRIKRNYRWRLGLLLHCVLEVEEAIVLLSAPSEQKILASLQSNLASLYNDYTQKPEATIKKIIKHFEQLLAMPPTSFADRKKLVTLYHTIYLGLNVSDGALERMGSTIKFLILLYGIAIEPIHQSIKHLIKQVEERIMALEGQHLEEQHFELGAGEIAGSAEDAQEAVKIEAEIHAEGDAKVGGGVTAEHHVQNTNTELEVIAPPVPKIQDHLDQKYRAILQNDSLDVGKKLQNLLLLSTDIKTSLERFNTAKTQEHELQQKKNMIAGLLEVFSQNDQSLWGRKYSLQLIEEHSEAYDLLMENSSGPKKDALRLNIAKQQERGKAASLVSWAASWVISPLNIVTRAVVPKKIQDKAPSTLDSEAKALVQELARDLLSSLETSLIGVRQDRELSLAFLSGTNTELRTMIEAETAEQLNAIAQFNATTHSYEDLLPALQKEKPIEVNATAAISLKIKIQDSFQQHYINLLHADGDEKTKISALVECMNSIAANLDALIMVRSAQDELGAKAVQAQAVLTAFELTKANSGIECLARQRLAEVQEKLDHASQDVSIKTDILSLGDPVLSNELAKAPLDHLRELVNANRVADGVNAMLLSVVANAAAVTSTTTEGKTAQAYLNERHIALLTNDMAEEHERLEGVVHSMAAVDKELIALLTARKENNDLSLKEQQMRAILSGLEASNANKLLINLAKERLESLASNAKKGQQKADSIAQILSAGKAPLKKVLLETAPDVLLKIIDAHQAANECIKHYKELKRTIDSVTKLTEGISVVSQYVVDHDTWWVRFTNFLAQFCSIFKSNSGLMIDQANALKGDLSICTARCQQAIVAQIALIKEEPHLSGELLGDLPERHNYEPSGILGAADAAFDPAAAAILLRHVSMFRPVKPKASKGEDLSFDPVTPTQPAA